MRSLYCSEFFLRLLSITRYLNKFLFKEMDQSLNTIDNFKLWLLFLAIVSLQPLRSLDLKIKIIVFKA